MIIVSLVNNITTKSTSLIMEKHILSKSTYIKGEQCLKQLYLHKKRSFLRDRMPAERQAIFRRGTNVGIFAQELFPGGIDAGPKHPSQYRKAVEKTALLIQEGQEIIYEAGFQANKTLILLDILVKNGDAWDAYEVKSSKKLSETYYKDAALQFYILEESGLKINSFSLINIDVDYSLKEKIEIDKLFIITDVTEEVKERKNSVKEKIELQLSILEQDHSPKIEIGTHCFQPYDCDFIGHCWKNIPSPSIFEIPSLSLEQQFDLHSKNNSLNQILENENLDQIQLKQIKSKLFNEEILNVNENILQKIHDIKKNFKDYVLLKILHFTPALPLYQGTQPYQSIAFAFSIMPFDGKISDIEYFIADGSENPEIEIMSKINEVIMGKKAIVFNINLENIETFDLLSLLETGSYFHPDIHNDYSNKSIAKAIGMKPPWKGISSDIVAAQYYDETLRHHKDSEEKMDAIIKYLKREIEFLLKLWKKVSS